MWYSWWFSYFVHVIPIFVIWFTMYIVFHLQFFFVWTVVRSICSAPRVCYMFHAKCVWWSFFVLYLRHCLVYLKNAQKQTSSWTNMHNINKFNKNSIKITINTKIQIVMEMMSSIKTKCDGIMMHHPSNN